MSGQPPAKRLVSDIVTKPPTVKIPYRRRTSALSGWLRRRWLLLAVAAIVVLLAITGGIIWWRRTHPTLTGSAELIQVEQEIGRHYLLPTGEQPVLATVTDATQITSPFLKQAKDGDEILIYANAKVVIIYRPSIDRIVAVGPVEITPPAQNN